MAAGGDGSKYSGGGSRSDPAWRVVIAPGPSRRMQAWVALVAAAAMAATLAAAIPPLVRAALVIGVAVAAFRAARRHGWQEGRGAVRRFVADLSGRVEIEHFDGRILAGALVDGSFVAPFLVIVRWRPDGARLSRAIALAPDAVEPGALRRLRILLRWR